MARTTEGHILPVASWFWILRVVQLVFAIILLGLFAYLANVYTDALGSYSSVYSGAFGVGLFTAILTILLTVYYLATTFRLHQFYHPYAVLGLDALAAVFWLITYALVGRVIYLNHLFRYYYYYKRDLVKRDVGSVSGSWDASIAFAIFEWLLFLATLVLLFLAFRGHSHTGTTSAPVVSSYEDTTAPKHLEAGHHNGTAPVESHPMGEVGHNHVGTTETPQAAPAYDGAVGTHPTATGPVPSELSATHPTATAPTTHPTTTTTTTTA